MALFSKSKGGPKEKKQLMELLQFIVAGTQGAAGYAEVPNVLAEKIQKLEPGLIQPKSGAEVNPAGNIAVYATSKGITAVGGEEAPASGNAEASKTVFKLEKGIPLPPTKRGGIKTDIYPFAQMEVGDSFFVAATEEKANPAKSLASTASSASKRFASSGRKFVVRAIRNAENQITGARLFCIAAKDEAEQAAA